MFVWKSKVVKVINHTTIKNKLESDAQVKTPQEQGDHPISQHPPFKFSTAMYEILIHYIKQPTKELNKTIIVPKYTKKVHGDNLTENLSRKQVFKKVTRQRVFSSTIYED